MQNDALVHREGLKGYSAPVPRRCSNIGEDLMFAKYVSKKIFIIKIEET